MSQKHVSVLSRQASRDADLNPKPCTQNALSPTLTNQAAGHGQVSRETNVLQIPMDSKEVLESWGQGLVVNISRS